jgi:hypothetical protein
MFALETHTFDDFAKNDFSKTITPPVRYSAQNNKEVLNARYQPRPDLYFRLSSGVLAAEITEKLTNGRAET